MTASEASPVGVLIVDDDPLVRAGLAMMLGDEHVLRALRAGAAGFVLKDTPPAEIAAVLYLSVPTVKTHVSSILTKLDLNNRVQVALLVHDAGLVDDQS
jgi:DNA-binding NarL/FixJ family response regulator